MENNMKKYHVNYWYLATGQEGIPYEQDYGVIEATNAHEAKMIATKDDWNRLRKEYPNYTDDDITHIALDGIQAKLIE